MCNKRLQLTHVSGVEIAVPWRRRRSIREQKRIEKLNDCYSGIGKTLAKKTSAHDQYDFEDVSKSNGNILSEKPRNIGLEFGKLTIAYAPTVDVRKEAIVAVEFVPSQRFTMVSELFPDDYFVRSLHENKTFITRKVGTGLTRHDPATSSILQALALEWKAPNSVAASNDEVSFMARVTVGGATGDVFAIGKDRADSLQAAASHLKAISIQLQGDDALIAPLTPSRQAVRPLIPSTWLWRVRFGGKYGKSLLRVVVADADLPPDEGVVEMHTVDIRVEKPWDYRIQQFFSSNWQWIVVTFILPYVIFPLKSGLLSRSKKEHVPFKAKVGRYNGRPDRGKHKD